LTGVFCFHEQLLYFFSLFFSRRTANPAPRCAFQINSLRNL